MREALTEALQDYDGALIVVAHDRHLLRATTDELWLVAEGRVAPFDGDLDDYRDWVLAQRRGRRDERDDLDDAPTADRKTQKRVEANLRQRRFDVRKPLLAKQAALEREMELLAVEKKTLDDWLAGPTAYAEDAREQLKATLAREGEARWRLARLEAEWLDVAEALERIDGGVREPQPTIGPGR